MAGLGPVPLKAPYTASKYAIVGLSRTLAGELEAAKANIRVVVVCPGPVATTMVNDSIGVLGAGVGTAELELLVTLRDLCNLGISGEDAGEIIVGAIRANRFWVLPNAGEFQAGVESAHRTMMLEGFGHL
jgi:NAD(P)-dependent dehydrogenase (short-subunit alcohol dehydrogenase family)